MKRHDRFDLAALLMAKALDDERALEALVDNPKIADAIVLFHAQQAAEKTLKAVVASQGLTFEWTHDLSALIDQVRDTGLSLPAELEEVDSLTPYAVDYRYEDPVLDDPFAVRDSALDLVGRLRVWADTTIVEIKDREGRGEGPLT